MPSECLTAFQQAPDDDTRATFIDRASPDCGCEAEIVSEHAQAAIQPDETLVRLVFDPTHVHYEEGKPPRLKSSFFSDAVSFGSSTLRKERATAEEYIAAAEQALGQDEKMPNGREYVLPYTYRDIATTFLDEPSQYRIEFVTSDRVVEPVAFFQRNI